MGWAKKYTGQRKVLWFTGTSRMWKNRINNAPLRSSNTHTHAFSSPFSTAMARGTSTLVHMPILVCTHHCVHKHKFQSVKNKSSQTKTYEMYKSELLYHSMQSATYYRRLPSVSPAKVPSLSSSVFLLLFLVLSFSLAL